MQEKAVMTNLIHALDDKAAGIPHKKVFVRLDRKGVEKKHITFRQLQERATSVAGHLRQMDLSAKPLVMLLKTRIRFIICFFGCIYAGVLPVPMPVPRHTKSWARLKAVVTNAGATHILADQATLKRLNHRPHSSDARNLRYEWLAAEDLLSRTAVPWQMPDPGRDDLAFLQYTSGSTGNPKGVMLSHGNLLQNCKDLSTHFGLRDASISLSWLPLFHDMGLVAHVVQPVVSGCTAVLMDPADFVMQPLSWLKAISAYRANFSGAPNFAYELCLRQIPPKEDALLDLSSWEVAYCGAEPVRRATLENFCNRFGKRGFRRKSIFPVYGLSEATLMVSGKRAGEAYRTLDTATLPKPSLNGHLFVRKELVSCGTATGRQRIRIVDPVTKAPAAEGQIGEIRVSGPNVAKGYWRNPRDTGHYFVKDPTGGSMWFNTGDLGLFKESHLYIAGRTKEILIVNGANYAAEDMEYTLALCHPGFMIGGCALFAIETDSGEQPVAACEIDGDTDLRTKKAMLAMACGAITETYGIGLYDIVFAEPGKLPRTTSGKIQRHVCRKHYLNNPPGGLFERATHPCLGIERMEKKNGPMESR